MQDFKSYNNNQQKSQKPEGAESTINLANEIIKEFAGKSQGQIWQAILEQAEQGKRAGTLTNDDLDKFFSTIAPLVDGFKRKKLYQVIEQLKAI
jgi:basic membrane lipoprotein Med (substrate-binding protein (PBP1-ABC) superfamily)